MKELFMVIVEVMFVFFIIEWIFVFVCFVVMMGRMLFFFNVFIVFVILGVIFDFVFSNVLLRLKKVIV